jgi:hypothetical protein
MRPRTFQIKRRVWVGLGCALVVTAAWWRWSQLQVRAVASLPAVKQPAVVLTGIGVAGQDQAMREQAALFDPAPLFFPTEWNYGQRPLPAGLRRQPGQVFESFPAKASFTDQDLKLAAFEAAPTPEKPADVLGQGNGSPFAGMGQVDIQREPLPERSGFVEIRGFKSGKVIMEQALVGILVPRPDYSPIEFIVAVSAAGVVADPVLATGSGWEEVDAFFRTYLVKSFRVGERLNPGRYRVFIGP